MENVYASLILRCRVKTDDAHESKVERIHFVRLLVGTYDVGLYTALNSSVCVTLSYLLESKNSDTHIQALGTGITC